MSQRLVAAVILGVLGVFCGLLLATLIVAALGR